MLRIIQWLYQKHRQLFNWLAERFLGERKRKVEDKDLSQGNRGIFERGIDKPKKEKK